MLSLIKYVIDKFLPKSPEEDEPFWLSEPDDFIYKTIRDKDSKLLTCCILSALVYKYKTHVDAACYNWGITEYIINSDDPDIVYGIFKIDNTVYLVFKGSSTFEDFTTNIQFLQIDDDYNIPGKMHLGFYKALFEDDVYNTILKNIEKFSMNGDKICDLKITGHSLGGAMASIFDSYYVHNLGILETELISYGCPRVGDSSFSNGCKGTRVVNRGDIVTMIPPPLYYRHYNNKLSLGKLWSMPSVKKHNIKNYYNELKKIK